MNDHQENGGAEPERPASGWPWRHRLPLALIVASGASLSFILFFIVREAEAKRNQADFERRATIPITAMQDAVDEHMGLLRSIAAFHFSSEDVDRHEFRAFTKDALKRLPAVHALACAWRVPAEQRIEHETAVKAEGHTRYQIIEVEASGTRRRAAQRAAHFPMVFVEPETRHEAMLGVDLAADAEVTRAMDEALAQKGSTFYFTLPRINLSAP